MGNLLHRLLFRHNIAKLALGQFLLVLAILVLDPYPVHDAYCWQVQDSPFPLILDGPGQNWPLVNLPPNSTVQSLDAGGPLDDVMYVNTTPVIRVINGTDRPLWMNVTPVLVTVNGTDDLFRLNTTGDDVTRVTVTLTGGTNGPFPVSTVRRTVGRWAGIGSVVLHPDRYEIWVLRPAKEDGNENYMVRTMEGGHIRLAEPGRAQTREYDGHTFHLDSTFVINEKGLYQMEADRSALGQSYYMMVVPQRSVAYPLAIIIGWLLIGNVVAIKGTGFLRWLFRTTDDAGTEGHRFVFHPDVAYFFAMGPEPNWKGGAFFRFPLGTREFFRWEPLDLEFPAGTAEFFDLPAGPP